MFEYITDGSFTRTFWKGAASTDVFMLETCSMVNVCNWEDDDQIPARLPILRLSNATCVHWANVSTGKKQRLNNKLKYHSVVLLPQLQT